MDYARAPGNVPAGDHSRKEESPTPAIPKRTLAAVQPLNRAEVTTLKHKLVVVVEALGVPEGYRKAEGSFSLPTSIAPLDSGGFYAVARRPGGERLPGAPRAGQGHHTFQPGGRRRHRPGRGWSSNAPG